MLILLEGNGRSLVGAFQLDGFARNGELKRAFVGELGVCEADLGEFYAFTLALEDDFFGVFGEVIGFIHLFQLMKFLALGVEP